MSKGYTGSGIGRDRNGNFFIFFTDACGMEEAAIQRAADMCQAEDDLRFYLTELGETIAGRINQRRLDRFERNVRREFGEPEVVNLGLRVNRVAAGNRLRHSNRR